MPAHRNDTKAAEMLKLYNDGFSLARVATAFGITRQSVHKMFAKRGIKLRTAQPVPFVIWNGDKFSIRPHGYYARTTGKRDYLHRAIWSAVNGPLPEGHDVHHKNGDKADNKIQNLELVTCSVHGKIHVRTNHGFRATQFKKGQKGTYYPRKS